VTLRFAFDGVTRRVAGARRERNPMGDKSPKKVDVKKPSKSLKEKRAAKHQKQQGKGMGGS
jgi:hypothetical protein